MIRRPPPTDLSSLARTIHVWPVTLAASIARIDTIAGYLDAAERSRVETFQGDEAARRFLLRRGLLRLMLGRYLDRDPATVRFMSGAHGKPALDDSRVQFNYAASDDLVLMAFCCGSDIGVDVERVRAVPDALEIALRYLHASELRALTGVRPADRDMAFLRLWTYKEALIKADGRGLALPLDAFSVTVAPSGAQYASAAASTTDNWELREIPLPDDYLGALAYRRPPRDVICHAMCTVDDLVPG